MGFVHLGGAAYSAVSNKAHSVVSVRADPAVSMMAVSMTADSFA